MISNSFIGNARGVRLNSEGRAFAGVVCLRNIYPEISADVINGKGSKVVQYCF